LYEGKLIKLRPFELSDIEIIIEKFNNYEMRRFVDTPIPYSKGLEEEWIKGTWESQKNGNGYYYLIQNKSNSDIIGSTGLDQISHTNRTGHFGITIFEAENWNKGYGTDAIKLMLSFGFELINLHSIYLRVYDYNERAIKVYKNIGFRVVGKLREAYYIEGKYHDILIMDLLKKDYSKQIEANPRDWVRLTHT